MGFVFYTVVFLSTEQPHFKAPQPNMAHYYRTESTTLHPLPLTSLVSDELCPRSLSEHSAHTEWTKADGGPRAAERIPRSEKGQRRAQDKLKRAKVSVTAAPDA